jgi:hypothetical protein
MLKNKVTILAGGSRIFVAWLHHGQMVVVPGKVPISDQGLSLLQGFQIASWDIAGEVPNSPVL